MFTGLLAFGGFGGLLGLLCLILWIVALVDCLKNSRLQGTEKLIWVLVIIFLPLLGSLLYFIIGKGQSV
ncbi:MAG TPA: PLD nuclease N-terminal domain-containing protein [Pirellulales bacterium]|nr:PLD nuclease N-terminal domain-containing protein [Pirellulales bacterium]